MKSLLRFEVPAALSIKSAVFWDVLPRSLVECTTVGSEKPARSILGGGRSALKMVAAALSETFVPFYLTTQHLIYLFTYSFIFCLTTLPRVQTVDP
jgi:hypothetical protein